jgi:uncharacterized protein (TIGR00255 family)
MRSMTGFGEGEAKGQLGRLTVQINSVNSRYFKLKINMPREFARIEPRVRLYLKDRIGRGQYGMYVGFESSEKSGERAVIDRKACRDLARQFKSLKKRLGIRGDLDMMTLVSTGAIVKRETTSVSRRPMWALLREAVASACEELLKSQEREGRTIKHDLLKRWRKVNILSRKIDDLRVQASRRFERKIRKKVRTILEGAHYDESRLLAEVSIYADKVDITEEVVRLNSHLKHLRTLLAGKSENGRKLDFTVQEILREVNTCANKANDDRISRIVIHIKSELEKMREQLQNVQ